MDTAIAVLNFNSNIHHNSKGIAYFYKVDNVTNILLMLKDITPEYGLLKGLHIHECGDVTDGCNSACAHHNPTNSKHGSLTSAIRHYGDLGNAHIDSTGYCIMHLTDVPIEINDIVGRSLVLHEAEDDYGLGKSRYSMKREEISRTIMKYLDYNNREVCYHLTGGHNLLSKQLEDNIGPMLTGIRRWNKNTNQLTKIVQDTMTFMKEKIKESEITGNSGSRIACGIIGYCKPKDIKSMLKGFKDL
jgi:superoxide dismutase, Cu-Zn family